MIEFLLYCIGGVKERVLYYVVASVFVGQNSLVSLSYKYKQYCSLLELRYTDLAFMLSKVKKLRSGVRDDIQKLASCLESNRIEWHWNRINLFLVF